MKEISYINLDECESYKALSGLSAADITNRSVEDITAMRADAGAGLSYHYAAMPLAEEHLSLLEKLAGEQQLLEKFQEITSGKIMNTGEERKVLHHLSRGELAGPVLDNTGGDIGAFYREQQVRFSSFARAVHAGRVKGSTGKAFTSVVQIGIGGSDLGPRALCLALEGIIPPEKRKMKSYFISNVDPDDAAGVLESLDPEQTLFVLVSKSGTTQETLTNRDLVLSWMEEQGPNGLEPAKHVVAVTSATSPLAKAPDLLDSFYIDDFIGGRYSSTSAVGGVIISLSYGPDIFEELLSGAHEADQLAFSSPFRKNAAILDGTIGMYLRNVLGFPSTAVLPYSQALSRFPAHLQQLDMESNGKRVNRDGDPIAYSTGPVIFGEPGTNGQHSFYQLLHQGTDTIPLQFIGFRESQRGGDRGDSTGITSQRKLNANLAAQIVAFAKGKEDSDPNKTFPGARPSSLLVADRLTPKVLGALLAHYENKVMFQGLLWNINSFDQEGVQLGKILTNRVLSGEGLGLFLEGWDELLR
jgi:glucose-6-phosphate isomerase